MNPEALDSTHNKYKNNELNIIVAAFTREVKMAKASISNIIQKQLLEIGKQISKHEKALGALKKQQKNIKEAARLLGGKTVSTRGRPAAGSKPKAGAPGRPATRKRRRRTNWDAIAKALPSAFTMDELAKTSGARGKSRAYLHQIINRWKKAGVIKSAGRAKYQRV